MVCELLATAGLSRQLAYRKHEDQGSLRIPQFHIAVSLAVWCAGKSRQEAYFPLGRDESGEA